MVRNITWFVGAALVLATTASAASPRPAGKIADLTPLTVSGTGFKPSERVAVYVELRGDTRIRKTRASETGRFSVSFTGVSLGRCGNEVEIRLVGSQGSRVTLELRQPDCYDK